MPTYNYCLLCNKILSNYEEKLYGSHFHCPEVNVKFSDISLYGHKEMKSTFKIKLVLVVYNCLVICLFGGIFFLFK